MKKILFVCHGNICRSVMAEYILKNKTSEVYAESRAVSSEETGNDIYYAAKKCLDNHHIKYDRHYACKISQKDYDDFDEIYVMDDSNLYLINRVIDNHSDKIRKLDNVDIDDPWYTGDFEGVYKQIDKAIDRLLCLKK